MVLIATGAARHAARWLALLAVFIAAAGVRADDAGLPNETASVATMPADLKHVVYLTDQAFSHLVDGLVHIVDGDSLRYLGKLSLGFTGIFNTSRDGRSLYTVSTYYERLNRGARTDTIAIYDASTLLLSKEIVIPTKRAQEVPNAAFLVPAWSGPWLYAQNATPASSVTIVDAVAAKVVTEVQTAGCFGIFPSTKSPSRFTSFCGDGSAVTISLDAAGHELSRKRSAKLFDPEGDALFLASAEDGDKLIFISFHGLVHLIDVSGESAVEVQAPWSIVHSSLASEGWRPGGSQVVACQVASQQLFVTMHRHGKEGSHKNPADEIWQVDLASHRVVKRILGAHALSLAVTQDAHPLLFAVDGDDGSMSRYDIEQGLVRTGEIAKPLVETASALIVR